MEFNYAWALYLVGLAVLDAHHWQSCLWCPRPRAFSFLLGLVFVLAPCRRSTSHPLPQVPRTSRFHPRRPISPVFGGPDAMADGCRISRSRCSFMLATPFRFVTYR